MVKQQKKQKDIEFKVFTLYIMGLSEQHISKKLSLSVEDVKNILNKMSAKK
ncbi:MAG TPA: hypothetical protein PLS66_06515 [Tepiditoga sp.]|nr:hypothetical protein [Tepiditoga sp.]